MTLTATSTKADFDSKEGIASFLTTLKGFHTLQRLRAQELSIRNSLNRFVIFGNWLVDGFGQMAQFKSNFIPRDEFPNIPTVLTIDEFLDFLKANGKEGASISWAGGYNLAEPHMLCYECRKPWTINNCHDIVGWSTNEDLLLENFVGSKLEEVIDFYQIQPDGHYCFDDQIQVRNDRWIDLAIGPDQDKPVNKDGWTDQGKDYIVQSGDEMSVRVYHYFHRNCNMEYKNRIQQETFEDLFRAAGFKSFLVTKTPNLYRNSAEIVDCRCCASWFKFTVPAGNIVIGWRKRVIHIDWFDIGIPVPDVPGAGENVTCGSGFTHAWGNDKAIEYLTKIRAAIEAAEGQV